MNVRGDKKGKIVDIRTKWDFFGPEYIHCLSVMFYLSGVAYIAGVIAAH